MERDELGPALLPAEHTLQALSRGEVARDELERLAEASQRLVAAMEAGVEDLRGAEVELGTGPRVAHPGELRVVDGHQRGPVLGLGVQPAEAAEGDRMTGHAGEHGLVALHRLGIAVQRVLQERGEPELDGEPLALVPDGDGEGGEHVGQLLGTLQGLVQGGERAEDRGVLGILVAGGVEGGDGVLGPLLPDVGPGQGGVGGDRGRAAHLGLGGEHRDEGLVVAGGLGGPAEGSEGHRVPPVEGEGLAPAAQCLGTLAQALVEGGGGLERVGGEPRLGQGTGEEDLDPEEARDITVRGEHALGLDQQPEVRGLELEGGGEHLGGVVPPVESIGEHLGLLEEERGPRPRALGGGQLRVEELEDHGPVPDVGEDASRGAEVLDEPRGQPVRGLEGGGGGAEVPERPFPEQPELVVQPRAARVRLQRLRLSLERCDAGTDLRDLGLGGSRGAPDRRFPLGRSSHAACAAARSVPESMSAETASMSRWISRSSSIEGTT